MEKEGPRDLRGTWGRGNGLGWGEPSPVPSPPLDHLLLTLLLPLPRLGSGRGDSLGWWEGAGPGRAKEQEGGAPGQRPSTGGQLRVSVTATQGHVGEQSLSSS